MTILKLVPKFHPQTEQPSEGSQVPLAVVATAVVVDVVSHGWWRKWNPVGLLVIEQ